MRLWCQCSCHLLESVTCTMLSALSLPRREDGHHFPVGGMVGRRHFPVAYRGGAVPGWEKGAENPSRDNGCTVGRVVEMTIGSGLFVPTAWSATAW